MDEALVLPLDLTRGDGVIVVASGGGEQELGLHEGDEEGVALGDPIQQHPDWPVVCWVSLDNQPKSAIDPGAAEAGVEGQVHRLVRWTSSFLWAISRVMR